MLAAPPNTKIGGNKGYKQWDVAFHTIHGHHGGWMLQMLKLHTLETNSGKKAPRLSSVALNGNALCMLQQSEDLEEQHLSKHLAEYSPAQNSFPESI